MSIHDAALVAGDDHRDPAGEAEAAEPLPESITCDVLVIGYGPVGMSATALLALYGLDVVATEKHTERYAYHRAGHFDGETMRIFQRLGVAEAVELVSQPLIGMEMLTGDGEVLDRVESGQSGSGWKADYLAYQPDYERAIDTRGRELGARVLMGTSAVSLEQDADGVRCVLTRGTESTTVHAKYVLGADGANSFTRTAVGATKEDLGFHAEPHLVVDIEYTDPDVEIPGLPDSAQILDPARPKMVGRWGGRRHARFEFAARDGEDREALIDEQVCWDLIGEWGVTPEVATIVRRAVYDFESSVAEPWRVGRVLLLGDAAHTMPPHMGQGMQSGIRDAENLVWKLSAVLRGAADDSLLDTYETERKPHVQTLIAMSSRLGSTILLTDPEQVERRNAALRSRSMPRMQFPRIGDGIVLGADHPGALDAAGADGRPSLQARVARGTRVDRLDNLLPRTGWRLVSRHPVAMDSFDERQRVFLDSLDMQFVHASRGAFGDDSYWDIDAEYGRWYGSTGRRAFLERPDHYVFGTAEEMADVPALVDALAAKLAAAGWHAYAPQPVA